MEEDVEGVSVEEDEEIDTTGTEADGTEGGKTEEDKGEENDDDNEDADTTGINGAGVTEGRRSRTSAKDTLLISMLIEGRRSPLTEGRLASPPLMERRLPSRGRPTTEFLLAGSSGSGLIYGLNPGSTIELVLALEGT